MTTTTTVTFLVKRERAKVWTKKFPTLEKAQEAAATHWEFAGPELNNTHQGKVTIEKVTTVTTTEECELA